MSSGEQRPEGADTVFSAEKLQAAVQLGLRYLTANGVPPHPGRGVALIEKAAELGDAEASYFAATLASSSLWRPLDWDRAFDCLLCAAEQGHELAQGALCVLAGGPEGDVNAGEEWTQIRGKIDLAAWLAVPTAQLMSESPEIWVAKGFLPAAACEWLIARARSRLSRATIYDQVTGGTIEDGRRTNSQCDLDLESGGVLTFLLRARIENLLGRPEQALEIPRIFHYAPGETFAEHCDYLDPNVPAYREELNRHGQRSHTFLVYLNDDFEGGETRFPKVDFSFRGATGDALLFTNVDSEGAPDGKAAHIGMPPTSGEKWLFSQWIRNLPVA